MPKICVPLTREEVMIGKKQHCFEIPYPPLDLESLRRPGLQWWTLGEKAVDVAQDLQILTTIAALARDLSPEFGRSVQAGIEQAAHSMKERLPEGVELHFGEQTAE